MLASTFLPSLFDRRRRILSTPSPEHSSSPPPAGAGAGAVAGDVHIGTGSDITGDGGNLDAQRLPKTRLPRRVDAVTGVDESSGERPLSSSSSLLQSSSPSSQQAELVMPQLQEQLQQLLQQQLQSRQAVATSDHPHQQGTISSSKSSSRNKSTSKSKSTNSSQDEDDNIEVTCHDFRQYFDLLGDSDELEEEDADDDNDDVEKVEEETAAGMAVVPIRRGGAGPEDTGDTSDGALGDVMAVPKCDSCDSGDGHLSDDMISMEGCPTTPVMYTKYDDNNGERVRVRHQAGGDDYDYDKDDDDNVGDSEDDDDFLSASVSSRHGQRLPFGPVRASECYMESYLGLRTLHTAPTEERSNRSPDAATPRGGTDFDDDDDDNDDAVEVAPTRLFAASPGSPLTSYKSHVQRMMQKMEEEQVRVLEQLDAKSLQFQERMEKLLLSPGSIVVRERNRIEVPTVGTDKVLNKGRISEVETKDENHTASTRSVSMSSLESPTASFQDDEGHDNVIVGQTDSTTTTSTSADSITDSNVVVLVQQQDPTLGGSVTPQATNSAHVPSLSRNAAVQPNDQQVREMQQAMGDLECENRALRALRESYQHRFAFEQKEKVRLQKQVADLLLLTTPKEQAQPGLERGSEDTECNAQRSTEQQRTERSDVESNLERRNQRIRRDFDKLWKEYKTLQASYKDAKATIHELEGQAGESEKEERKWKMEKNFMKEKMEFLREKVATLTGSLKSAQEETANTESKFEMLQREYERLQQENRNLSCRLKERDEKVHQARREKHQVKRENRSMGDTALDKANQTEELRLSCRSLKEERDALQAELIEMGEAIRKAYSL